MAPRTRGLCCGCVFYKFEKSKHLLFSSFQYHSSSSSKKCIQTNWTTQPFYATLMKMLIDYPIFSKKKPSLLTLPGKTAVHKILDRLDLFMLLVCLLSGDRSKIINFRKTLQTSLCRHGEKEPQNNTDVTSTNGRFSVEDGISIQFTHL